MKTLLEASVTAKNSLLCIGLDPRSKTAIEAAQECMALVDATHDVAAVYKPNSAFFEQFGSLGFAALKVVVDYIRKEAPGTLILLDAKRGDIGDTSVAYAHAAFDEIGVDAITVAPYMGRDSVAPFIDRADHGAFVLCKTSNPGSNEFQTLDVGGQALFERVARQAQHWSTHGNVGLVVGATDPAAILKVRAQAPEAWLLIPGVGAQGGDLASSVNAALRQDGMGLLLSVSRSIAQATDPHAEALRLRDEINAIRSGPRTNNPLVVDEQTTLAMDLLRIGAVKFGQFTLKSGAVSPLYMDLRVLVTHPDVLKRVAKSYARLLAGLTFDRLAGIPYAALPIGTAVSLDMERPLIYPRKEAKEYGTKAAIEGDYAAGETVAVIDDLISSGGSKFEAIEKLESAGLKVRDVVVLIDRSKNATELLAARGYALHSVVTIHSLLPIWRNAGSITQAQFDDATQFLTA